MPRTTHPGRDVSGVSIQIALVEFHARLKQKLKNLLAIGFLAMVLLLASDVVLDGFTRKCANGESGISVLPLKVGDLAFLANPGRRGLLEFPHEIRKAMGGLERYQ